MTERHSPTPDPSEIAGRYQIISKLGAGAFGTVYKAKDSVLGRMVAIKTIRLDGLAAAGASIDELVDRFNREARIAAQLKHPNIVTIYDVGESEGQTYLAMEYIDGIGLDRLIASSGSFPAARAAVIGAQVADALNFAHRHQVVHRDIKPANVMIESEDSVKVTDFGIAKPLDSGDKLTVTGSLLGTPSYMSPEQARGGTIDGRSDLFALGCILYEMLCGKKAFSGESITGLIFKIITEEPPPLRELAPTVPDGMLRIVNKALSKVPEIRYQTGQELAQDLLSLVGPAAVPTVRQADVPTMAISGQDAQEATRVQPTPASRTRVVPPPPPPAAMRATTRATVRRATQPAPARKGSFGVVLALLAVIGLFAVLGAAAGLWLYFRRGESKLRPEARTVTSVTPELIPTPVMVADQRPEEISGEITERPPATMAPSSESTVTSSLPSPEIPPRSIQRLEPPPAVASSSPLASEPTTISEMPPSSDYAMLDQLPNEGPDGTEAGRRLSGIYRRQGGSGYGGSQPVMVRRRVPIGKPAERPVLRLLNHIVNSEEAFRGDTGRYGTLAELVQAGNLSPAVAQMIRNWSARYYRVQLQVADDGFTLTATPLMRGSRSFATDDSGIIRPQ